MRCAASGARSAIALLDEAERLVPDLRAVYEYRSSYWRVLGNEEAAKSDSARAEQIERTRWLAQRRVSEPNHEYDH